MASPQTILVIGANRGIGFELATRFIRKGYAVFGTYRPQTRDDSSVADLKAEGVKTFEVDFTDEESIATAAKDFGNVPLDILVNCAGAYEMWDDKPFTEMSPEDFIYQFKVNLVGPFIASKAFLPALTLAEQGRIINISSDFASIKDNTGGNAPYRVSKTGVNQLTKTMAVDLGKLKSKVLVLAVHPGWVPTRLTGWYGEDDLDTCMLALAETVHRFGTDAGKDIANGAYVRWDGQELAW